VAGVVSELRPAALAVDGVRIVAFSAALGADLSADLPFLGLHELYREDPRRDRDNAIP